VTRTHVPGQDSNPSFPGAYAYRALVPRQVFEEAVGRERTADGQCYFGLGGFIISYPVEKGKTVNMVAVRCKPGGAWTSDAWLSPPSTAEMKKDLKGWSPALVELMTMYGTRYKCALFDTLHSERYFNGRICLMGDLAHATRPHLGAGAAMAIEDAYVLSRLLSTIRDRTMLDAVFEKYDEIRRERTRKIVQLNRRVGLMYAYLDESVQSDMVQRKQELNDLFHWIWYPDLAADS
jgi:salicylate hydroxylase